MSSEILDLSGDWKFKEYPLNARRMRDLDADNWLSAKVPSSIYTNLIDAGIIDRTEINTNPEKFVPFSDKPWIYKKTFDAAGQMLRSDRADLVFEGLDTVTQIWLNDKLIGKTDNMFIEHRFDVTGLLKPSDNILMVKFNPAAEHAEKLMNRYGLLSELYFGYPCRAYIRKAQYQFGWDFCPPLPGCGIWRNVRLEGIAQARIEDLHVRTVDCNDESADVKVELKIDPVKKIPLKCCLTISGHGTNITQQLDLNDHPRQSTVIRIDNPALWWPIGYGEQNLYQLKAQLTIDEKTLDQVEKEFGLRTIRLNRTKEKHGESFRFDINSKPFYAKGANWIPVTLFPGSVTHAEYENLLARALQANINMLRVWGGGYYENDEFYAACDRLGIMVWQDFMFACAYYPDRKWFLDIITKEAAAVIKRLRNHPSLALWCGNSEIDFQHSSGRFGKGKKFYGKPIFHKLLGDLLSELDPDRDYIPSMPLGPAKTPNEPNTGTFHQWHVWGRGAPTRDYITSAKNIPRFVTEFGLQAVPDVNTIKTFCPEDQLRIASPAIEKHNYYLDGNPKLARYIAEVFPNPENLDQLSYLSQLTQARAAKKYVEHLRAHNHINHGVLFWYFRDCCPAVTFSAIDHKNNPKALYYYTRRFFAPVLVTLICEPQKPKSSIQPAFKASAAVVINDSLNPLTATLACRLIDMHSRVIDQATFPVALGPFSNSRPFKLPKAILQPEYPDRCVLRIALEDQDSLIAENHFLYLPDKYTDFPHVSINRKLEHIKDGRWKLSLQSDAFVKDLQIVTRQGAELSDNFIDLLPEQNCEIIIDFKDKCACPENTVQFRSVSREM